MNRRKRGFRQEGFFDKFKNPEIWVVKVALPWLVPRKL